MRLRHYLPSVLIVLALTACVGGDDESGSVAGTLSDTMPLELGPNDLLITNTDSAVDLALVGDRVIMKFSPRMQAKLRADLDTARGDTSSGLGSMISKAVKKNVGALLNRRIEYPLSDITSARYADGRIEFDYRKKHALSFESVKVDKNRPVLETFTPADAERFVAAVTKRKTR